MSGFKAYIEGSIPANEDMFTISGPEAHHIGRVLRARTGDGIIIFNGSKTACRCEILSISKQIELQIHERLEVMPPRLDITLAQVMTKGKSMDLIIRQAVELGVRRINPIKSERCEVRLKKTDYESKNERWKSIAIEACKQSGNLFIPEIMPIANLENFLKESKESSLKLIAALEQETESMKSRLLNYSEAQSITYLVGPEGDFTSDEYFEAKNKGFLAVNLSDNVLRSETAASYGLSLIDGMLR